MLPFPNRLYGIAQFCFVANCSLLRNGSGHLRFKAFKLMSLASAFRTPDFRLMPARLVIGMFMAGFLAGLALLVGVPTAGSRRDPTAERIRPRHTSVERESLESRRHVGHTLALAGEPGQ